MIVPHVSHHHLNVTVLGLVGHHAVFEFVDGHWWKWHLVLIQARNV